jgi:hypothetical protein
MGRLPAAQFIDIDGVGQGATGLGVGDQDPSGRGEQLGGFGHEVHPAEDDLLVGDGGGDPGEGQRIAHVIGNVLDLGQLVVVGQDHGAALAGEITDLICPIVR